MKYGSYKYKPISDHSQKGGAVLNICFIVNKQNMEPNKKKMPQKTISFVNLANGRYGTAQKLIKETSSLFWW